MRRMLLGVLSTLTLATGCYVGPVDAPAGGPLPVSSGTPPAPATPVLQWEFAAAAHAPLCGPGAGNDFDTVELDVDGQAQGQGVVYGCADGLTASGVQGPTLAPGTHSFELLAYSAGAPGLVYAASPVVTADLGPGTSSLPVITLDWQVGGVAIFYNLANNPNLGSCSASGISAAVNFQNTTDGSFLYGTSGDPEPACPGASILYLAPASLTTHQVLVQADSADGLHTWTEDPSQPVDVQFQAGVFGDPAQPLYIPMVQTR